MRLMVNFKMTKKVKNIMFLILVCCFFGGIGLFNYSVDPYNVFHNKDYMNLDGGFGSVFIKMKAYKNIPYSTVIIGGSEVSSMFPFCEFTKKYFNRIAMDDGLPHKFFGSLLKPYIDLHPETEKVIIFINYMSIISPYIQERVLIRKKLSKYSLALILRKRVLLKFGIMLAHFFMEKRYTKYIRYQN